MRIQIHTTVVRKLLPSGHGTCRQAEVVSPGVRRDEQGDPDYHFDADADPDPTL
jgi:hypothetical protein